MKRILLYGLFAVAVVSASAGISHGNLQRTGAVSKPLTTPLQAAWTHTATHLPRQAWREPIWESQRIDFDYAYMTRPHTPGMGGGITAYAVKTGERLWQIKKVKNLVPIIVNGVFYSPTADDLQTRSPDSKKPISNCLLTGEESLFSIRRALQATEQIFATYESCRHRSLVYLPLEIEDNPLHAMIASGELTVQAAQ